MINFLVLICGFIFGIGLIFSGMSNPSNVINFLNIAGKWNPSLLFVMLGAIPVSFIGFRWFQKEDKTVFNDKLHLPGNSYINKELIVGSFLFGIGWALTGFCPGPALVALSTGSPKALLFVLSMLIGMFLHDRLYKAFIKKIKSKINPHSHF